DDAPARHAADAERDVEGQAARRDGGCGHLRLVAELHDRALAELPLDLGERCVERLRALIHGALLPRRIEMRRGAWAECRSPRAAGRSVYGGHRTVVRVGPAPAARG